MKEKNLFLRFFMIILLLFGHKMKLGMEIVTVFHNGIGMESDDL